MPNTALSITLEDGEPAEPHGMQSPFRPAIRRALYHSASQSPLASATRAEMNLSTKDRLLLAFANLASYGIAAHPSVAGDAKSAHARLASELRTTYPHGLESYVFWLHSDECRLSARGDLVQGCELPLHYHSHGQIIHAIAAACRDVSIEITVSEQPGRLIARDKSASGESSRDGSDRANDSQLP
jgi:hypothetical protein